MLQAWASLHGFTCLEAYGHFDWVGEEAREELFRGHPGRALFTGGRGGKNPRVTVLESGKVAIVGAGTPAARAIIVTCPRNSSSRASSPTQSKWP